MPTKHIQPKYFHPKTHGRMLLYYNLLYKESSLGIAAETSFIATQVEENKQHNTTNAVPENVRKVPKRYKPLMCIASQCEKG